MPYIIDVGGPDGRSVRKQLSPDTLDDALRRLASSKPLSAEEQFLLPTTISISKPDRGGVPHVLGWKGSPYIISPGVRQLFELLEPRKFKYFPINVVSKDKIPISGKVNHGDYYLLHEVDEVDCVLVNLTQFQNGYGRPAFENAGSSVTISNIQSHPCALNGRIIAERHFWRGRGAFSYYFFCSSSFHQKYQASKFDGFKFKKKCSVYQQEPEDEVSACRKS